MSAHFIQERCHSDYALDAQVHKKPRHFFFYFFECISLMC